MGESSPSDLVSDSTAPTPKRGLARMERAGVEIVTTEMVLFEWLRRAGDDRFRRLLPLIK